MDVAAKSRIHHPSNGHHANRLDNVASLPNLGNCSTYHTLAKVKFV